MICLDFDGVLFDTAREAYIIAHKSYCKLNDDTYVAKQYLQFLLLRPFVVSPWQYLLVFDLIFERLTDQVLLEEYKKQYKLLPNSLDIDFESKFNDTRNDMIKNGKVNWLNLHKPYDFFLLIKPMLIKYPQFFQIVSTKHSQYIIELLNNHGVCWEDTQVWGRDIFVDCERSKAKILRRYISKKTQVIFVDDNTKHLKELEGLSNVEAISANWGYTDNNSSEDNTDIVINRITYFLGTLCN